MENMIINCDSVFLEEPEMLPGVKYVVDLVRQDFEKVFGSPAKSDRIQENDGSYILVATIGYSRWLEEMEQVGELDLSSLRGKREVYLFQMVNHPKIPDKKCLVIAGSDKRGTIYGAFRLSEMVGVSPLVNWNDVRPIKRNEFILTSRHCIVSKEPSVKYRGFFINDEWPAFGTWAQKHFGGINAKCYEKVFELLLRLKGNYLWPAMWASNFELDGPGLQSAELADMLGVVMSMSHHEPCMRSGGEYALVRGANSIYGDAWDFSKNPEGIRRFWRDGLLRTKDYEQVITMGMRGENDTAIMKNASLESNIAYLRKVIKTQNDLIRETMNEDLDEVKRQIVLFTEVEEFFYGNETCPGLAGDKELEGITLMFSDNNTGATRTLPSKELREHKGGCGMYYHQDMHGGPHSYQWIGSTYLPKLQLQMSAAYEYGVQEIWVTNIGDIGTQELGLSYFLDLAYDMDKWGIHGEEDTIAYTDEWTRKNFEDKFSLENTKQISEILQDYCFLLARRKHETMNASVYHPVHYGEADEVLGICNGIEEGCEKLKKCCLAKDLVAFISLVYYPAMGTANLMKMWVLASKNALYARQNRVDANDVAEQIKECIAMDEKLIKEYMTVADGKFHGLGLGEHIGFTHWSDEDNKFPICMYVEPATAPRMIVARVTDDEYMTGGFWSDKPQTWKDTMMPVVDKIHFTIASGSDIPVEYKIECEDTYSWLTFSQMSGTVEKWEEIVLYVDKSKLDSDVITEGFFRIKNQTGATAQVKIQTRRETRYPVHTCIEYENVIAIEAAQYTNSRECKSGRFETLMPYGRTGSAVMAFPLTTDFMERDEKPYTEYEVYSENGGEYELSFYMEATTPVVFERKQYIGYGVNGESPIFTNTVWEEDKPFFCSRQWEEECINNIKIKKVDVALVSGVNKIRFYGASPMIILERMVLGKKGARVPDSYLGARRL